MGSRSHVWLVMLLVETYADSFNILILNDMENIAAKESSLAALEYIKRHSHLDVPLHNVVNVDSSECNGENFLNSVCSVYKSLVEAGSGPHLVIDLTRCREVSNAAERFIRKIGLPAVSTSPSIGEWSRAERSSRFHLQLLHPLDMVLLTVHAIVQSNQLSSVAILYDETYGTEIESEYILRDVATRLIIVKVESKAMLRRVMIEMREVDVFNYVVLGSLSTVRSVLDSLDCDSYWRRKLAWYIITLDKHEMKFSCKNLSLLLIQPDFKDKTLLLRSLHAFNGYSENLSSVFYFEVIVKSLLAFRSFLASNTWFKTNFSYSLCDRDIEKSNFLERTEDFTNYFKQESGPEVAWKLNERGYMDLRLRLEVVGTESVSEWRPNYQTSASLTAITPRTVYKVVTVLHQPFVAKSIDEAGTEHFTGFCIDLLNDISELMGFDFEIYVAPDNSFGAEDAHGNWSGLIRELMDKKADIGMTSLTVTAERENVVEFTVPFYDLVGMSILMKRHSSPTSNFKFLAAMEKEVWLGVVITWVFASFLLWMFAQFNPHTNFTLSSEGLPLISIETLSLKDCLWFCITSLTPQGSSFSFRNLPAYITVATWWLFGFVILSSYTANLAAFLTVSRLDREIQTLSDLAKQSGIQYATINGSSYSAYFERMAMIEQFFHKKFINLTLEEERLAVWDFPLSTRYTHIWKAMQEAGLPNTQEDAVERVLASKSSSDGFAYIGDGTNIRYQVITNCALQMVRSMNTVNITKLLNQRRLEKLKEIWWDENPDRQVCEDNEDSTEEGVILSNIGGVFSLVVLGVVLACCTLLFEYCGSKHEVSPPAQVQASMKTHYRRSRRPIIFWKQRYAWW